VYNTRNNKKVKYKLATQWNQATTQWKQATTTKIISFRDKVWWHVSVVLFTV